MPLGRPTLSRRAAMLVAVLLATGCASGDRQVETTTMTNPIDFQTLERPSSPNTFLVAPTDLLGNTTADAPAPQFAQSPEAVFATLLTVIKSERAFSEIATDDAERAVRFVATVPVFGFKDDVDAVVIPIESGSTIAVYSRSRVGYSDLGVNKKRTEKLLAALDKALR